MSNSSGPAHRSVSNIRQQPAANPGPPASPHTPVRTISSTYGSPSALRAEDDCVVIELGSRFLRIGFAGDASPKAVMGFGPEEQRRAGDYRKWELDYGENWRKRIKGKGWGEAHELWKLDLRGVDLGMVSDKIERAIREAFTKYLLIDSRPRRMALVLPSALPLPLLSVILDSLFTNFQPPTISLMSGPVLTTVAAGLRSATVVDIGWAETVVTSLYEYREVHSSRSVRGSKLLGKEMFKVLAQAINHTAPQEVPADTVNSREARELVSFEECEEIISRMAWCRPAKRAVESNTLNLGFTTVTEEGESILSMKSLDISGDVESDAITSIPLSSTTPPRTIILPFSKMAEACETALFAGGTLLQDLDEEELPLHLLVYRSLLALPVDVRSMCMSRIVFVGGGSSLLGLRERVLNEVTALVEQRGWNPVHGKAVEQFRTNPKLTQSRIRQASNGPTEVLEGTAVPPKPMTINAALVEHEADPIEDQLKREASKGTQPVQHGRLRAIESLGAWSGGSLLSQLKVPAVSIIDREQWLQYGVAGASRAAEVTVSTQRQSMGPGAFKSGVVDRSGWTLGLWG